MPNQYTIESLNNLLRWEVLSKPVFTSLCKVMAVDPPVRIEGSCGKHQSFTPFSVTFASGHIECRPTRIHQYVKGLIQIDMPLED